jgi:hypothetical protein
MILNNRKTMRLRGELGLVVALALAQAGCGDGGVPGTGGSAPAGAGDPEPSEGFRMEGTPAGGLETWLAAITTGMPTSGSALTSDWQAQHRQLLELYIGKQEYVEMYWGPNGRLQGEGGVALGQAVLDLETAFHEVLQRLVAVPLDTAGVLSAAAKVRQEAAAVWDAAALSGLPLVPPADSTPAAER